VLAFFAMNSLITGFACARNGDPTQMAAPKRVKNVRAGDMEGR
jgi:hypothetical protein